MLFLQAACKLAGGVSKLARHLGVSAASLARWLRGDDRAPTRVFVACVDIVLLHERYLIRGEDEPARRRFS